MAQDGLKVPVAVDVAGIVLRIVGTLQHAVRRGDLELAARLRAVVSILGQGVSIPATALVGSEGVPAPVLAATIVNGALIHI